ncbi:MAG: hypothetical protein PHU62_07815 [Bacteroidales bacterium]|jgi:hypothetical protein|nr:hypothetical protein [Bacteroidales bacterium]MDD2205115.1 hypothetical protein [Bacteroidales bacterium]MDD3152561.1 hypothetical protein [Bacteroidales bacterium]MDD3914597.1 hypothetical protein [Bacteroidales bacterium]MDD4634458.1 hypothetical protein [Bacteroidales bacterium]
MIKERVKQLIESQNIAKEEFYKKVGVTSANFRGKALKTPLNSSTIANIFAEIPDVNLEWLITGRGEMLQKNEISDAKSDEILREIIREKDKRIEELVSENAILKGKIVSEAAECAGVERCSSVG